MPNEQTEYVKLQASPRFACWLTSRGGVVLVVATRPPRRMDSPLVLVVDDEPHICLLVRETLRQAGMSVRSAADGRQALRALEEQDPALILLDVGLPDIDGFSLCARIREGSHAP